MKPESFLRLVTHVYWYQKECFSLERDIYPYWTMFAVEDGRFAYSISDREGEAGFGDLVVCPPNTWFHRRTLSPLTFHFLHFIWESEPELTMEQGWTEKLRVSDTERLSSDYRYLKRLASERDQTSLSHKQHLLNDLLRLVEMERGLQKDTVQAALHPEVQQAHQFMLAHAYGPIDLRYLAHSLRLTPVQLTRRFRSVYGVTPTEFITELRLSRACRLLEETLLSIDKIAQRCGYENGFYLSRVFRQKRGMTPSFYRKTHRV
ncbi:AraC family transcriptional regulator [Paenibacillus filicis]|uniref:AraC family transcriptional regulator n=1 Tax=Paenibacillus gyeongsangnamensis TaxID=3388067 RepID=A0ABT4QJH5_9BACL|nr:AraC family transcriptional regulator [Paenibacillus filicis]MCZ8516995.1 AraC family transcriptional regulator [Paenibacillus filicis]